jgi:hypothetical protein
MLKDSQGEKPKQGRPLAYAYQDSPMTNYTARTTAWHARQARRIGGGNFSEGVRMAVEHYVATVINGAILGASTTQPE